MAFSIALYVTTLWVLPGIAGVLQRDLAGGTPTPNGASQHPKVAPQDATQAPWVSHGLAQEIALVLSCLAALSLGGNALGRRRSTEAWRVGDEGEGKTEAALSKWPREFVVLHDRRVPGSRANIDHIVIGPSGVFTIETKNSSAKRVSISGDTLLLDGRNKTQFIDQALGQAAVVSGALGAEVEPLLCIHGPELPRGKSIRRVRIVGPRGLLRVLQASSSLDTAEVSRLEAIAERRFVPMA